MDENGLSQHDILGLPMVSGTQETVAAWLVKQAMRTGERSQLISHINANNLYRLHQDPDWQERITAECVLILDGIGLQLGAFLTGSGWLPNLNGTDLFPAVMRQAESVGLRVFILGSRQEVAERTGDVLCKSHSGLQVVGCHSGYFRADDEPAVVAKIRECHPHLLLVGCGFLRQERFALQYRDELKVPLIWNVGGLFEFLSGRTPRAPRLLRIARLEWFFRLLQNPRAMWHRNLVAAPWFLRQVLKRAIARRQKDHIREQIHA